MAIDSLIQQIQDHKAINRFQSVILILAMLALLSVVGFLTLGTSGFVVSIFLTLLSVVLGQQVSTAWIMRMYHAQEIRPHQASELMQSFQDLIRRSGLSYIPKLYYIPTKIPNAFATGHNRTSAVAVTDGILRLMSPRELRGILAHEVAHLMHRDTKVMSLADTMARITSTASRIGFFLLVLSGMAAILTQGVTIYFFIAFGILFFSPSMMMLLQLALSRSREFDADLGAIQLTHDPIGLASALQKLERLNHHGSVWHRILHPGEMRSQPALLRTHPPTDERIRRLMKHVDQVPSHEPEIQFLNQPRRTSVILPRVHARPRYHISSGLWY